MSLPVSNRPEFRILRSIFSLALALSPAMLFGQGGDPVPNYVVNTTADDATGTASNCTSSPEGICTLRDALAAASAVSASNITFDPTVFLASNSAAANTITLAQRHAEHPVWHHHYRPYQRQRRHAYQPGDGERQQRDDESLP